ncbi:hypothetical protein P3551_20935 [Vibrio parahaemolyticus]|uniref:hypothetical protein n=1 Tax=Vibrio parahaemolyticus TaxID=670 RepID=UPI0015DE3F5A|nr:hypothetical protein [Vibrio parahaemolyticus]MBE4286465.1 hypothetical protein [Vibrio parahaemolyticus]MDF4901747.1 hypothetical protein [Vibrio parahaemolyticus]HCG7330505.1 hypothetical protein [Vibrio parahaemolyticus]HCG9589084.1 hypothetical protein [Vibrio parahaemolyticus]HCM0701296.1 hypothetical protein [Vibrio parahaemolyticus]
MSSRLIPTSNGRAIILRSHGNTVILGIQRNSPHIGSVCISWTEPSIERAVKFVDEAKKEDIEQRLKAVTFCADFMKQLEEALAHANTEKATQLINRANGSHAFRRYGL